MKAKLTRNPVHDGRIGFDVISCSPNDPEKKLRSVYDVAISIQCLTLTLLPMHLVLGIVKLGAEF